MGAHWPRDFSPEICGNSCTQGHCLSAVLGEAGALGYLESAALFPCIPGLVYEPQNVHPPLPPCDLGGLGIRRFGGLAGEIDCLRGRTVFYEFAEKYTPRLLEGATLDVWPPIVLGAAENRV